MRTRLLIIIFIILSTSAFIYCDQDTTRIDSERITYPGVDDQISKHVQNPLDSISEQIKIFGILITILAALMTLSAPLLILFLSSDKNKAVARENLVEVQKLLNTKERELNDQFDEKFKDSVTNLEKLFSSKTTELQQKMNKDYENTVDKVKQELTPTLIRTSIIRPEIREVSYIKTVKKIANVFGDKLENAIKNDNNSISKVITEYTQVWSIIIDLSSFDKKRICNGLHTIIAYEESKDFLKPLYSYLSEMVKVYSEKDDFDMLELMTKAISLTEDSNS